MFDHYEFLIKLEKHLHNVYFILQDPVLAMECADLLNYYNLEYGTELEEKTYQILEELNEKFNYQ